MQSHRVSYCTRSKIELRAFYIGGRNSHKHTCDFMRDMDKSAKEIQNTAFKFKQETSINLWLNRRGRFKHNLIDSGI